MKEIAESTSKAQRALLGMAGVALGLVMLGGFPARADVAGPVVGFVRVQVKPGPQWVTPTVQPCETQTDGVETNVQALTDYLGDEFVSATNANGADWIGLASGQDDTNDVTMIWRDQQGKWHDLLGNAVEPDCAGESGFWVDLVVEGTDPTIAPTRELVLSGEVVW